jgi:hypothetical protein
MFNYVLQFVKRLEQKIGAKDSYPRFLCHNILSKCT